MELKSHHEPLSIISGGYQQKCVPVAQMADESP